DVGGPSEQPDEGDRRKAAVSDALKRAAVKFGLGRYLYRLPDIWVDYDPQRRRIIGQPPLPHYALPASAKSVPPAAEAQPAARTANGKSGGKVATAALPANGTELQRRLTDYDNRLAKKGLCAPGDLVKHVIAAGTKAGHDPDLTKWSGPAILLAVEETRA